ncbi:MAG: DUF3575 domain-containing protein [Bacteroidetes bacterium]|nr:DUF3575 domain-containing protein [Bacteroidota bacterium]MBU1720956.1 DUF3575 domain-containing protein [Bacteroidota bacterium]
MSANRILSATLLCAILVLFMSKLQAQDTIRPKIYLSSQPNILLKTNPLSILSGPLPLTSEYRIMVETTLSMKESIQLSVSYLGKNIILAMIEDSLYAQGTPVFRIQGYRFQFQYKYYFEQYLDAPEGFYVSPHFSYSSAKIGFRNSITDPEYIRMENLNINLLMGRQWNIDDWAFFDAFIGFGYKSNTWHEFDGTKLTKVKLTANDISPYFVSPFKFNLGFNFGIGF